MGPEVDYITTIVGIMIISQLMEVIAENVGANM